MEVLKEKQKCSPESVSAAGFTLIEILTVLIVVGVLATVAFHSYSRYKESSQFETYSYNMVLGLNRARAEAQALSRKVRLCAGFRTMVDDLRTMVDDLRNNPQKAENALWTQCKVEGSDWKFGWYLVSRTPTPDGGYVPEVVEMKPMAGRYPMYPMKAKGGALGYTFSSNGNIESIDSSAGTADGSLPVLIGAVSVKNSVCKFVYAQTMGDIVRGECELGTCGKDSIAVHGSSEPVDASKVCSGD